MSDNKKYYYLRLKENFFDSDELIVLESLQDGFLYSNILLKLYLRSLKYDGKLMFKDKIPYNSNILAKVTRQSVGVVEKAIEIFKELGLIEILDNGAIYMSDIQEFIGSTSTEADRKRKYRNKIEEEKTISGQIVGQMSRQLSDKNPPEIEIEIKKEKETNKKDFSRKSKTYSDDTPEMKICDYMLKKILNINPNFKQPDLQKWCVHVNRMINIDKREPKEICKVIRWVYNDDFWYKNILSTNKLREKYDKLYMEYKDYMSKGDD